MTQVAMREDAPEIACTRCGYNLHTLNGASLCPECGHAVAESIAALKQREATFGPPLRAHSAAWLRCAASGLFAFLLGGGVIAFDEGFIRSPLRWLVLTAGQLIGTAGVWLFTIRPMRSKLRGEWLRWVTRILLTTWCIASGIANIGIVTIQHHVGGDARIWIASFSCSLGSLAGFLYLVHLAGRMRRLLVRRVFLVLLIIPILMTLAVMKTVHGVFLPTLLGVTLPWPNYPFITGVTELVSLRFMLKDVFAGRVAWPVFLKKELPLSVVEFLSLSAMLWYAMILLGIGTAGGAGGDGERS